MLSPMPNWVNSTSPGIGLAMSARPAMLATVISATLHATAPPASANPDAKLDAARLNQRTMRPSCYFEPSKTQGMPTFADIPCAPPS